VIAVLQVQEEQRPLGTRTELRAVVPAAGVDLGPVAEAWQRSLDTAQWALEAARAPLGSTVVNARQRALALGAVQGGLQVPGVLPARPPVTLGPDGPLAAVQALRDGHPLLAVDDVRRGERVQLPAEATVDAVSRLSRMHQHQDLSLAGGK